MTVSNHWQTAYLQLFDFIAAHPEIKIDQRRVSIPDGVRDEFYRQFDTVTTGFVQDKYAVLPTEAAELINAYLQVERRLLHRLALTSVSLPSSLDGFLHSPPQGLAKALFDPLFQLLQGKIDQRAFEDEACRKLSSTVDELCRLTYPYWVSLELLRLLEPDAIFRVELDSMARPVAKLLDRVPLGQPVPHPILRLADLVIHSQRLNKYIAVKLELASEICAYTSDNRADRKRSIRNCGKTASVLASRLLLLYALPSLDQIPIVADLNLHCVARPHVVVECFEPENGGWDSVKQYDDILQPELGTYVVARPPLAEPELTAPYPNMYLLALGVDATPLERVCERLGDSPTLNG